MIATRRGLVILGAIACALLVVLVIDLARRDRPVERALVPGFDEASVVRLQWTAHPIGPYLTLERATSPADAPWKRTAPTPGAVEQAPVQGLLATLRGARWHRMRDRAPRADAAAHLAVDRAGGRLELWIGRAIEGSEQAWIGIGDRSFLVDAWVARALVPSPLELAIRAPLAGIASVDEYVIDGVRIEGVPRRMAPRAPATPAPATPAPTTPPSTTPPSTTPPSTTPPSTTPTSTTPPSTTPPSTTPPSTTPTTPLSTTPTSTTPAGGLVLDPAYVADLERALAELAIEELPRAPMGHGEVITVEMAGTRVQLGGPCESRVYMTATTGDGCVSREKADVVRALVEKLHGPPAAIVARAPVPVGVESVTLVDGAKLDLRRRPTIDGADARTDEVLALMAVLRSPVDPADVVAAPTTKPIATLSIDTARGELAVSLHAGNVIARPGEPVALRLAPEAFAVLRRDASTYKDRTPWREEPTTIDEISVDDVVYKRGVVLGEWTRTPAGRTDAASIDALVRALAEPRVLGVAPTTLTGGRRVRLVVRPPTGGETSHTLMIGAANATGCPAKIDTTTVLLPVEICRLVPR